MVNFTLLAAGYFFIPTDILELCCGMQLNYLERTGAVPSLPLIFPHFWGKILLFSVQYLLNLEVFQSGCGKKDYSQLSVSTVSSNPFWWFFPQPWGWLPQTRVCRHTYACTRTHTPRSSVLCWMLQRALPQILRVPCSSLFSGALASELLLIQPELLTPFLQSM